MRITFNSKRIAVVPIFLILLVSSCINEKTQVIDVDYQKISNRLEVYIDTIICLETNDNSLIGEVTKIKYYKNRYFVLDQLVSKNLFQFNIKGKFLSKLPRGKGPEEIMDPVELFIDKERELILVWDQGSKRIFEYDIDLNYLNCNHNEDLYIDAGKFIDNNRLLIYSPVFDNKKLENKVLYSIYNLKKREYENHFFPISKNLTSISPIAPISVTPERILFSAPFDNSLYALEGNGYREVMHFDFGEMGITADDIKRGNSYVFSESWAGRKIIPFYSISENERYMALNFGLYGKDNFFIYSKATNETYFSFNLVKEGLLPNCRLSGQIGEDQFLAFASPADVIEFGKTNPMAASIQNEIEELSNPCIIVFSIHEDK
jgi:hypothetical protein